MHQIEADQQVESLPELTPQQISDEVSDDEDFRIQITKLEEQLSHMKPNMAAIAEYRKKVSVISSAGLTHKRTKHALRVPSSKWAPSKTG